MTEKWVRHKCKRFFICPGLIGWLVLRVAVATRRRRHGGRAERIRGRDLAGGGQAIAM